MSESDTAFRYGNFEVLARSDGQAELLGGGSFGKTYKARHVFLDQIVSLKVISEKFAEDKNAKERFLREARVVHGLRHPHIAQVIDFGEANNTLYYAMEYCEGGSLEELVKRTGPLDPDTVLLFAQQLAEALECSHRRGFIHRDVKPANVMLADKSDALVLKLVDFGLVKPLVQDNERMASLTLDGQNFFTPLFASPEQVMEEELDARSDLFSLGMTLWFLLKGNSPETGSTAVIMAKRLSAEPYAAQLPPGLPPKLSATLKKLLEKDKANRFSTATEVLTAILAAEPAPAGQAAIIRPSNEEEFDPGATLAFETPSAPTRLSDHYHIGEKIGRSSLGNIHRANRIGDNTPLSVTVLGDALRENSERMDKLRQAVTRVTEAAHESISQMYGLEQFEDAEVLVRELNSGLSLQSVIKSRGSVPFAEALQLLRMIAGGVDFATAAGLSGLRLAPDEISLQPADGSREFPGATALLTTNLRQWPPFRIRLTPILLEDEAAQDISMTLNAQSVGSPQVEFGSLLYRLVAGMQVKFAARVNRGSYIRSAGLSEEGNWILSGCIVDETTGNEGCLGVLQALQRAEGIADPEHTVSALLSPAATTGSALKAGAASPGKTLQTSGGTVMISPAPLPQPAVATQSTQVKTLAPRSPDPVIPPPLRPPVPPFPPPVPKFSPVATPPPPVITQYPAVPAAKGLPLVPIVVGLAVACLVLGGVAFVLLPKSTKSNDDKPVVQTSSPVPDSSSPTPRRAAPVSTSSTFTLRNGSRTGGASYTVGGRAATPEQRGSDLVFTLDGARGAPGDLVVKVPGYKPVSLSVGAGGSAELPAALERELASVYLTFKSHEKDYSYITFSFTGALPGEDVKAPADQTYLLKNDNSGAKLALPTGMYDYTLYGPAQPQDAHIAPMKGTVAAPGTGRVEVPVPATFAGRFRAEFDDHMHPAPVHVVRTIVLKPGLSEGHADEQYFLDGQLSDKSVNDVPLAEIRLDADGVLHAHIRYAGYRYSGAHTYDELFELRHSSNGSVLMTGGRETMPDDPTMRSELEKKLRDHPAIQTNRPIETEMRPID